MTNLLASENLECATFILVRVGLLGQVGRFQASDERRIQRRERVVCRTTRGIEIGEVLGVVNSDTAKQDLADGKVLRRMRPEDELLWGHLRQLSQDAFAHCQEWLEAQGHPQTLLEVEPLLDGRTLYFHFLTSVDDPIQAYADGLAQVYEQQVSNSDFAAMLNQGCGPGCGTDQAENGCGTGAGCSVCRVAEACRSKR